MGNFTSGSSSSSGGNSRRRNSGPTGLHDPSSVPPSQQRPRPPPPPQPENARNRYVIAAAPHYPPQYPDPNLPQYYPHPGYYATSPPTIPISPPSPFNHHHNRGGGGVAPLPPNGDHVPHPVRVDGGEFRHLSGPVTPPTLPFVEHQKAVTIRNDVNLKKETLRVEPDEQNPGCFLVAFTFDATIAGNITVFFFAKEGLDCSLTSTKENLLKPVIVSFKEGLGQKFTQPTGTGVNFSMFEETELFKEGEMEVYPLAVKAEPSPSGDFASDSESHEMGSLNSQITQAVFDKKDSGEFQVRVVKQILWVNGTRYELQEIYGIGSSVDNDFDGNDPGKECVICLSEPRDTTVLPCRHMCMCSECAKVLRLRSNRCPICRQPVERLLEIEVNNRPDECQEAPC